MQFPIKIDQSTMQLIKKWPMQFLIVIALMSCGYIFRLWQSDKSKSDTNKDMKIAKQDSVITKWQTDYINLLKEASYNKALVDRLIVNTDSTVRDKTEKPLKKILK